MPKIEIRSGKPTAGASASFKLRQEPGLERGRVLLAEERADFAPELGLPMVFAPFFPFQD